MSEVMKEEVVRAILWNVLYLDCGGGYMYTFVHTHQNITLQVLL